MPRSGSFARGLLAVGVFAVPAVASAQLAGYSPSTGKYRVESQIKISQSMMGQTQEFDNGTKQVLTVAMAGAAPSLDLTIVLDSASATSSMPGAAPDMAALLGMKLTGKISAAGQVSGDKTVDKAGAEPKSPVAQSLRTIFPRLKPGANRGDTWEVTDTTKANQNGIETTTIQTTKYTYAGDTTLGTIKAARITAESMAKVAGKGNAQGQDLSLEGETKSSSWFHMASAGTFLGGMSNIDASINVTVEAMGMVIPITQKGTNKVERLP